MWQDDYILLMISFLTEMLILLDALGLNINFQKSGYMTVGGFDFGDPLVDREICSKMGLFAYLGSNRAFTGTSEVYVCR